MTHKHDLPTDIDPPSPGADPAAIHDAAAIFAPGAIAGISTPLIGRDDELQRLLEYFYALIEGADAQLVTIVGEPGIGKSRLAHEFRQLIARLPETVACYTFRAERQMVGQPYSLVRRLIGALFRIRPTDPPEVARARLESGIVALLGPEHLAKAHFIGQLIGFDFSASPHLRGALHDARQIRDRAIYYALQCLTVLTAQNPLILLIDDFHYADESSIDLFEQVAHAGRAIGILLVCLTQPRLYERRPGWGGDTRRLARIDLQPLAERDSRRMVAEVLRKAGKLPADLRNLIVNRSEGNPFFVEELIKMLIADGAIIPGPEKWHIAPGRLSRLRIPNTLHELLRAQIQTLRPDERELLLHAAVIGRTFWVGALNVFAELGQAVGEPAAHRRSLTEILSALERKELIALQPTSQFSNEPEFSFRHELLHEVAYGQISPDQLARSHLRAAEWLVAHIGAGSTAYAGLIAEHYERAGQATAAAHWYLHAGQFAHETYALEMALGSYRAALGLLPPDVGADAARMVCYEQLGEVQQAIARLGDAAQSFFQVAELAAAHGDLVAEARAHNRLSFVYDNSTEPRLALASAQRAIELSIAADDPQQHAVGLMRLGWAELRLSNPQQALELGQRSLALFEQIGDLSGAARCLGMIGVAYEQIGDYARATNCLQEALRANRELGNLPEVATHLTNLGYIANACADYAGAIPFLEESLRIAREIGNRVSEIFGLSNLGSALNGLGAYAEAEAVARQGIHMCEVSRIVIFSDFYRDLALACLGQGRVDEAIEAAQQALDLARHAESSRELGAAWRTLGLAISHLSDPQGALPCFAESARIFAKGRVAAEQARTLREWAIHAGRVGQTQQSIVLLLESRALFAQVGLEVELARTPEPPIMV